MTTEAQAKNGLPAKPPKKMLRAALILLICMSGGTLFVLALDMAGTDYAFLAAYMILQFVAIATAWNILGGYAGYVNFGVAGFFAVGVYTTS